jgi:hypothetical protein
MLISLLKTKMTLSSSITSFHVAAKTCAGGRSIGRRMVGAISIATIVLLSGAVSTKAAVITASSSSLAAVQTAVNSASAGDTVQVPAGLATWTGSLTINKDIQLLGAGIGKTIITDGGSTALQLITWTTSSNHLDRLSGFTFTAITNQVYAYNGEICIVGTCASFRLDHCQFLFLYNANVQISSSYGRML